MRLLSLAEVLALHHRLIEQTGGVGGLRDLGFSRPHWLSRVKPLETRIFTRA